MDFLYILVTILFTVYAQLVVKWQVRNAGSLPASGPERIYFLFRLVFNPWVLSGLTASFLALLSWMAAMTKFEVSYANPIVVSLTMVLVMMLSSLFFREILTAPKLIGTGLILAGVFLVSRG